MTYADFEEALVAAGKQHLVTKMEEYTAEEAEALTEAGMERVEAHATAEDDLASHIEGWLSGRYGELTAAAVFEHRPLVVQAWAIAETIGELCGRLVGGNAVSIGEDKPFCPGCGRSVGGHGDWCNGCEDAAKALPPHDD